MLALEGTYDNGYVTLNRKIKTSKPVKIIITFLEEIVYSEKKEIKITDFSFAQTRKVLKNYKGSLSDSVIEERRSEN